jgi:hypothetical protein
MRTRRLTELERLRSEAENLRKDVFTLRRCVEAQQKRADAVALAWSVVHPSDKAFMMNAKHDDPDLFDVYNRLLYSFGRPDENGIVRTRIA